MSFALARILKRRRYPYGVEVVGDVDELLRFGGIKDPFWGLSRYVVTWETKWVCRHAAVAMYVTKRVLQRRYPCDGVTVGVSDVNLPEDAYVSSPRLYTPQGGPFRLVTVGSFDSMIKGPDVLLSAVQICVRRGVDISLTVVGGGALLDNLKAYAHALGVADRVTFTGYVTSASQVREYLDSADIFVLASRTEGVPRALLEAMARGLPCIASDVGGIPELLDEEDVVPAGDALALAEKLVGMLASRARLAERSRENLEHSRAFASTMLREPSEHFCTTLMKLTDRYWEEGETC